jgi:two-component SAPR family response regulator
MEKDNTPMISSLLVSEDNLVLNRFYKQALENVCEELMIVESPVEAIDLLKSRSYEFLITDLKLADKTGLDIISCAVETCPEIKILVASGYVTDSEYHSDLLKTENVKGYLEKPFTYETLIEKIESILSDSCSHQNQQH